MEDFKSRLDMVEKIIKETEIREQEYKEAETQKKGSLRMKKY